MAKCDLCGREEGMPYRCRLCGSTYCGEHRLPENHDCPGLDNWNDPGGVFEREQARKDKQTVTDRIGVRTGPGGPLSYFRNNVSYLFLALMWLTFVAELAAGLVGVQPPGPTGRGDPLWFAIFTLSTEHPLYVWTWVTSVFAHSPVGFYHILGNSIVLFFFGPYLERRIGSKAFAAFFLVSGMAAGLAQVGLGLLLDNPVFVLGASGAIMGILGAITVINPGLRVYLYFLLPIPIWVLTFGYAALSLLGVFGQSVLGGNVAHAAHLVGLVLGLVYGAYLKDQVGSGPEELQFGGRGGRRF